MVIASGVRIGWPDLPLEVRAAVESLLGAPVVEARSQPGGFSPGTADRVITADGTRAFVKAVSPDQNEQTPAMHRREAVVTAALPPTAPVPRLLGCYDDGHWVVLVLTDVEGRHPRIPWTDDELRLVIQALEQLARTTTPVAAGDLTSLSESLVEDFGGWARLRDDPPTGLNPWAAAHLEELCARAERALTAVGGETLVHLDIRADNLLLTPAGEVTIVDWPHAARGPAWFDTLSLLINVRFCGGPDVHPLLADLARRYGADPEDLVDVLIAWAGYFADGARRPAPKGLPGLRAFQHAQAEAVLSWLAEIGLTP
jgi:aminoglycoside phosphotransferase (APT) family kinase protein